LTSLTSGQPAVPRLDSLLAACPVFGGHLSGLGTSRPCALSCVGSGHDTARDGATSARSRGELRLRSADPLEHPSLDPRYFVSDESGQDLATLVAGVRLNRRIAACSPLTEQLGSEITPSAEAQSDEEIGHSFEEPRDLVAAEHHRQSLRFTRGDDLLVGIAATQGDAVEEPKCTDDLVDVRPRPLLRDQILLVGAHILQPQPVR
jgi:choline dehydrogenase-like flavoprotein